MYFLTLILELNNLWSKILADETPNVKIYSNSSHFELKSGISNEVEIRFELEIFDSANIGEVEDGLGFVIDNTVNYPLINLNGFCIEPDKISN